MESNVFPRCQCCGEVPENGLYDGIRVNGVLFCRNCYQGVTSSLSGDSFYERFFLTMKKSLFPNPPSDQTRKRSKAWSTIKGF